MRLSSFDFWLPYDYLLDKSIFIGAIAMPAVNFAYVEFLSLPKWFMLRKSWLSIRQPENNALSTYLPTIFTRKNNNDKIILCYIECWGSSCTRVAVLSPTLLYTWGSCPDFLKIRGIYNFIISRRARNPFLE